MPKCTHNILEIISSCPMLRQCPWTVQGVSVTPCFEGFFAVEKYQLQGIQWAGYTYLAKPGNQRQKKKKKNWTQRSTHWPLLSDLLVAYPGKGQVFWPCPTTWHKGQLSRLLQWMGWGSCYTWNRNGMQISGVSFGVGLPLLLNFHVYKWLWCWWTPSADLG